MYNRAWKNAQKERASVFKEQIAFKSLYDLPLMNLVTRLTGIRRDFKTVAFVGPNPYLFLQHLPKTYEIEKFYFCEANEASV